MNEVITKLYEIEETASTILKNAQRQKEQMQLKMQEEQKQLEQELEQDFQQRLAQTKVHLDEQAKDQIHKLKGKYSQQMEELDETYDNHLDELADAIFAKIIEV